MSLFQAIKALPNGLQKVTELYYGKYPDWALTLLYFREPLAGFLERTLCTVLEDPVEDEFYQWYAEFEIWQQNCANMSYGCQQMLYQPWMWYKAFRYCLKQELDIVSEEWCTFANDGLLKIKHMHQQMLNSVVSFQTFDTLEFDGFPESPETAPTEQDLLGQLTNLVEITHKCVLTLLEHKTYFRPSYFSSMSTEFPNWGKEYKARLESIQQIRIFMKTFLNESVMWSNLPDFPAQIEQMRQLSHKVDMEMTKLISQAMIVTKQPLGTIKKETKFDLVVQIFGSDCTIVNQMRPPTIVVVNESQAEALHADGLKHEITAGCGTLQACKSPAKSPTQKYNEADKTMTVTYERLSIPERPHDGSRSRAVLKQKFVILFHTELLFEEIPILIWACSTPFVYTTNVSQDCEATATMFWDTFVFYKSPFNIAPNRQAKVWQVKAALSRFITKETNISWAPNNRSVTFLMEKLYGGSSENFSLNGLIDRAAVDETVDPESGVTFWKWFMGAMKLLKDELSPLWHDGYVVGFIDRGEAENIINTKAFGTFLLRFSSSQVGGLCITWKVNGYTNSFILPAKVADLNQLILDKNDFTDLLYIDPRGHHHIQKNKNEVFLNASCPPANPENQVIGKKPYVRAIMTLKLVTQVTSMFQRRDSVDSMHSAASSHDSNQLFEPPRL